MKNIVWILGLLMLTVSACKKNQPAAATAEEAAAPTPPPASPEVKQTQVAEGEIKELMLALKRVHFPFDASTLTTDAKAALDEAAEKLRSMTDIELYVDGHTDDRGTTEYNMSLGERRAETVVNYLNNSGIEKNRLTVVSFGEEKPLASGSSAVAKAENRRVDFRLMKGDIQFVLEDSTLVGDDGKPLDSMNEDASPSQDSAVPDPETAADKEG